ncbi:hypothetical protein EXN66_Car004526 [Channa argus]|uniref:Uncharacterized protein n=1 Tax=Channa argus TaxID=215402 RepID=A0A6G1PFE9_CHAAH|nr:hypothetical protein EXN66_Car004526 [Channa argus]
MGTATDDGKDLPLHLGNWITSGAKSLDSPIKRGACLILSIFMMSSFSENMYVIFYCWRSHSYAFSITIGYFWVSEKHSLLDHSQSDITLKSG